MLTMDRGSSSFSAPGQAWDLRSASVDPISAVLQLCSADVLTRAIVAIA